MTLCRETFHVTAAYKELIEGVMRSRELSQELKKMRTLAVEHDGSQALELIELIERIGSLNGELMSHIQQARTDLDRLPDLEKLRAQNRAVA